MLIHRAALETEAESQKDDEESSQVGRTFGFDFHILYKNH